MVARWAKLTVLALMAAAPAAGQEFTTLKGHGGPIMGLAVAGDGRVASASFDNSVGLWAGRDPQWLEAHEAAVNTVAFVPDGLLSGGDDFAVFLWRDGTPREIGRHKGKVTDIARSAADGAIASASWDGTVGLWTADGAGRLLDLRAGAVNDVAFSPDGARLFAATAQGALLAGYPGSDDMRAIVKHGFGINEMIIDPGGNWLAYGAVDGVTRVIDPDDGRQLADFSLDRRPILSMAHHPDSNQLAVGDGHGFIMIIDTGDWRSVRDFKATRNGPIWALAFSPDGEVIYAGGLDDVVYAWPVALLDEFDPVAGQARSFLRPAADMPNGERQFMRKCSVCHALTEGQSRKAGPTLHGIFGRRAGSLPGYRYSQVLLEADIVWADDTIDLLFDLGPDHYIPGSKMPMQRITARQDRVDLIDYLKQATK